MKQYLYTLIFTLFTFSSITYAQEEDIIRGKSNKKIEFKKIQLDKTSETHNLLTNQSRAAINQNIAARSSNDAGTTAGSLSVSLSGAATYSVPVMLPPGVKNVAPNISLGYTAQAGNGLAGWGWNVSGLSTISRIPATKYYDGKHDGVDFKGDRYALDGQRLILKSGAYGASGSVYQTENYSNIKVVAYGTSPYGASYGPSYFVIYYPNGATAWYGTGGARSRLEWAINKWEDPQKVPVHYFYQNDNGLLSIKTIRYGGTTGRVSHMNQINFTYKTRFRPEKVQIGGHGFTRTNLLEDIQVVSNGKQYRKYFLRHSRNSLGYDRLYSVQEFNSKNKPLNPITFSYGYTSNTIKTHKSKLFGSGKTMHIDKSRMVAGDFDGDGKSDFLMYDPKDKNRLLVFQNVFRSSKYSLGYQIKSKPFKDIFSSNIVNHNNIVLDRQGITTVHETSNSRYSRTAPVEFSTFVMAAYGPVHQYNKTWQAPKKAMDNTFKNYQNVPKRYISGDFNGDGLTDVLAIEERMPRGRIGGGTYFIDLNRNKTSNFSNYAGRLTSLNKEDRLSVADYNGDGKADLIHIKKGGYIDIYSFNKYNRLERIFYEKDTSINLDRTILFGDYNGDGKVDLAVPTKNESTVWKFFISKGSNGFQKYQKDIGVRYLKSRVKTIGWASILIKGEYTANDFNNDGKSDIIAHEAIIPLRGATVQGSPSSVKYYENKGNDVFGLVYNQQFKANEVSTTDVSSFLNTNGNDTKAEHIFIKRGTLYAYQYLKDNREETTLKSIYNNGVRTSIDYEKLIQTNEQRHYQTYTPKYTQNYPYINVNIAPSFKVVKKLTESAAGITRYQDFMYEGAVSHIDLGFLGFQQTIRTNWYGNGVGRLYNITQQDPTLRGAVTGQWVSTSSYTGSNYMSRTTNTYSKSLANNKVWTLLPTRVVQHNGLTNSITTKNIVYDTYKNPRQETTTFNGGSKQVSYTYSNNLSPNNNTYHVGRITRKIETSTIGGNAFTTEERYSYSNNLLTQQNVKGSGTPWNTESFRYDVFGNVVQKTLSASGVASRTEQFKYDSSGRFLKESTDIEGLKTQFTYDIFGNPATTTNPYNQRTIFTYDGWNRLKTEKNYLGHTSVFTYSRLNGGGLRKTSNYPQGADEQVDYNALGWVMRSSKLGLNNKWVSKSFIYDVAGRAVKESEPYFNSPTQWNSVAYDNYGREVARTSFNGLVARISYSGRTVTVNDGTKTVITTKDGGGNTVRMQDPGGVITYQYHGNGVMKTANYASHVVRTEIDGWGRKTKLIDPSAGTYTYRYNNLGELLTETTPKGATNYTYDAFGKIKTKRLSGEETNMNLTYTYDSSSKLLKSIQGNNVRTGEAYSYEYTYDTQKRPYITKETNGKAHFERRVTRDAYGRVASETYINKNKANNVGNVVKVKNVYDASGILKEIRDFNNNTTLWKLKDVTEKGQAKEIQLGNGHVKKRTYNQYGFATKILDQKSKGATALNLDYTFDNRRGNLLNRKNNNFNWGESFTYDNLDRLTNITGAVERKQKYDNRGRIQENSALGTYAYTGTNGYRLKGVDLNTKGDLHYQNNPVQQVKYNAYKKPVSISSKGNGKVDFEYGILQNRSHAYYGGDNSNKLKRRFQKHYSSITPVEIEQDKQGNTKIITYIGGNAYSAPLAYIHQTASGASKGYHYLHRDYLGSILAITDSTGKVKEQRQFGAWGEIDRFKTNNSEVEFTHETTLLGRGYTGHEHFIEVGLIHMNGRMYDAKLGRFLSPDNYVQEPFSTQSFNRFGYVLNNPLKFTDESGEFLFTAILIGAALGAYFGGKQANGSWYPWKWNWSSASTWGGIIGGGIIGAVSGAAGGAAATALAPLITSAGGFIGGAISGIIGGAVGGFIQGGMMTGLPGGDGNFWNGALMGAATGAIAGGLIGGTFSGIKAVANGRGFWRGTMPRAHVVSSIKAKSVQSVGNSKIEAPELAKTNATVKAEAAQSYKPKIKVNRGLDGATPKLTTNNYDLIESIFKTADDGTASGLFKFNNGRSIEFLANIKTQGNTLHLTDGIFYPKGVPGNQLANGFGNRAMIQTVNSLKDIARNHGFSNLRLHFIRGLNSSSANPGHVFDRVFPLK